MPALYFRLTVSNIDWRLRVLLKFGLGSRAQFWINGNERCIVIIDFLCNTLVGLFKFPIRAFMTKILFFHAKLF
jgi:hypothetical protein